MKQCYQDVRSQLQLRKNCDGVLCMGCEHPLSEHEFRWPEPCMTADCRCQSYSNYVVLMEQNLIRKRLRSWLMFPVLVRNALLGAAGGFLVAKTALEMFG